mmetsp:Transcript_21458/g.38441  ORF Transcript_21458/g.38441 Transcript_21458/m.38441 type:complete len:252 (+) Transcript_21458:3-758(+)
MESIDECSVATEALPKMKLAKLATEMPCPTEAAPGVEATVTKEDESEAPTDGGAIREDDSEAEVRSIHSEKCAEANDVRERVKMQSSRDGGRISKEEKKEAEIVSEGEKKESGSGYLMSVFSYYFGSGVDDRVEGEEAVPLETRDDDDDAPLRIPTEVEPTQSQHRDRDSLPPDADRTKVGATSPKEIETRNLFERAMHLVAEIEKERDELERKKALLESMRFAEGLPSTSMSTSVDRRSRTMPASVLHQC